MPEIGRGKSAQGGKGPDTPGAFYSVLSTLLKVVSERVLPSRAVRAGFVTVPNHGTTGDFQEQRATPTGVKSPEFSKKPKKKV